MHVLEAPAVFDEGAGEPVEQGGVGGAVAEDAEVFGAGDEAATEVPAPEAVDGDAGGEGVLAGGKPAGEVEAAALFGREDGLCEGGAHDGGEAAGDGWAEGEVAAADVDGHGGGDGAVGDAHEGGGIRGEVLQGHEFGFHLLGGHEHFAIEGVGVFVWDGEEAGGVLEGVEGRADGFLEETCVVLAEFGELV